MIFNNKFKRTVSTLLTAAFISSGTMAYAQNAESVQAAAQSPELISASEKEISTELIQPQLTVTFADRGTVISQTKVEPGRFADSIPTADASGSEIMAWVVNGKKTTTPDAVTIDRDTTFNVWHISPDNLGHVPYIGTQDNKFRPGDSLTRYELCTILANIFDLTDNGCSSTFTDVTADMWYAPYIAKAAAAGIIKGNDDGTFAPMAPVTKAELIAALTTHWREQEIPAAYADTQYHKEKNRIAYAVENGWIYSNPESNFNPDAPVTRAEAVCIINRRLDRSAAPSQYNLAAAGVSPFCDVRSTDWYYADVMEAVVPHAKTLSDAGEYWTYFEYPKTGHSNSVVYIDGKGYFTDPNGQFAFLQPYMFVRHAGNMYFTSPEGTVSNAYSGLADVYGSMYYFNADGSVLTNGSYGYLTFDGDGRYTCGDASLDAMVDAALAACTYDYMQPWEKLRASYLYLRDNCKYLSRSHQARGATDFVNESASFMFKNMKGNCYCYAACFLLMARRLGYYNSYVVSGGVGTKNDDHAWVMIDGQIFDPELEYAYRYRYAKKKNYDLYGMNVGATPFPYHFPY